MPKVGLKETLSLLAAGYKKKDIDAMIAAEEENDKKEAQAPAQPKAPAPEQPKAPEDKKAPDDADAKESNPEPDYKKMYEELLEKQKEKETELKEKDEKIKKIQKDNVNSNSLSDVEKERAASHASLIDAIKSFY